MEGQIEFKLFTPWKAGIGKSAQLNKCLHLLVVSSFQSFFGATQEHLCSAHLEEDQDQEDETKRTGVVDSSSDRSRATE